MKRFWRRQAPALALAAVLLTGGAAALFGKQETEGTPAAQDLELTTYRDIPCEAQFLATGGEGEDLIYAVVKGPNKGTVEIDGAHFTYTPDRGAVGRDRFTYTATDSTGHVSAPATVTVRIEKTRSGVTYADTADSPAAAAAQELAEAGIFTGTKLGEQFFFEPDRTVSRSEFLALTLETAGQGVTEVTMTGFCDDAAIPVWAKAYASAGVAQGIVQGRTTAEGAAFCGEDPITLSEAATILDRVLDLGNVDLEVWYADREAVPSWAAQAVGNMEALNVLSAGSFGSGELERPVTRADAAQMLTAARTLLDGTESLLDRLV